MTANVGKTTAFHEREPIAIWCGARVRLRPLSSILPSPADDVIGGLAEVSAPATQLTRSCHRGAASNLPLMICIDNHGKGAKGGQGSSLRQPRPAQPVNKTLGILGLLVDGKTLPAFTPLRAISPIGSDRWSNGKKRKRERLGGHHPLSFSAEPGLGRSGRESCSPRRNPRAAPLAQARSTGESVAMLVPEPLISLIAPIER